MNELEDLVGRTLADERRALPAHPSAVDAALHRATVVRRRRAVVASLAAVVVIAAGVAVAVPLVSDDGNPKPQQITTTPSGDTTSPPSDVTPAPALSSPLFTVSASAALGITVDGAALGDGALYVSGAAPSEPPGHITVERVDPATLNVSASASFKGYAATPIAFSAGRVWVLPQSLENPGGKSLMILDAQSLDVVKTVTLAAPSAGLVPATDGVWVSTQDKLIRYDSSGNEGASVSMTGPLSGISADVAHDVFYTLGQSSTSAQAVAERDINTGAVIATFDGTGPGGGGLSATSDGVWASLPSGTAGSYTFLARNGLHPGATPAPTGEAPSNKLSVSAVGSSLWLTDVQSLACADPSSGRQLASDTFAGGETPVPVAGEASTTYLADQDGLYAVTPSAACTG